VAQISESEAQRIVSFVHLVLGPIEYLQISAPEMDQRIRRRHHAEIAELRGLGFEYLCSEGQRFPLSRLLRVFPALVAIGVWLQRTPIWIRDGSILFGYPILVCRLNPTFVELDASHAKFITSFQDGVLLVSANYADPMPRPGVLRQFKTGTLIETWNRHKARLKALESVGKRVDPRSDYETYLQASARDRAAW